MRKKQEKIVELNKEQKRFIVDNYDKMTDDELCKDMEGITTETIRKFMKENTELRFTSKEPNKTVPSGPMARDAKRGFAIMTESASQQFDEYRESQQNQQNQQTKESFKDSLKKPHIYRMRQEDQEDQDEQEEQDNKE